MSFELAGRVDAILLGPAVTEGQVQHAIVDCRRSGIRSLCLAPIFAAPTAALLHDADMTLTVAVSFPHGVSKPLVKAIEASSAVKDGADGVEVVAHLPYLARQDYAAARGELLDIVRAVRASRRETFVAVIIESAYLLSLGADQGEAAIATACRAIRESGCDAVTTSTGFHPAGGASAAAVQLIRKYAQGLVVKAAGGITPASAQTILDAGADRLGIEYATTLFTKINAEESAIKE